MNKLVNLTFLLVLIAFFGQKVTAQTEYCDIIQPSQSANAASEPCFDIDSIFQNCIPVYVKVNFHYFVKDDCSGNVSLPLDATQVKQEDATGWANYLIYLANMDLENNLPQLNASGYNTTSSPPHCNLIRWVLSGVYFHCDSSDKFDGYNLSSLRSKYAVNPTSEINIFMSSFNHTSVSGVAFLGGSILSVNRFDKGNLNHELAHNLNLSHSFEGEDDCEDTPKLVFDFDRNCDGQISTNPNDSEKNQKCWGLEPTNSAKCNPTPPCTVFPCCDPGWVNNNIMGYNNPNAAWTNCQILKALDNLANFKCDFITQVGGNCPPPNAFITRIPKETVQSKYCSYCFDLNASTNYQKYKVEIYDYQNPSNPVLIKSTNWITGTAKKYCIGGLSLYGSWQNGMQANHPYLIKLIVQNECDESAFSYPFTLPVKDCHITSTPDTVRKDYFLSVSPNPASNEITIHYELEDSHNTRILITHPLYNNYSYNVKSFGAQDVGTYNLTSQIQDLNTGLNVVVLQVDGIIFTEAFIKQ